ncbi:Histone-fold [Penicillium pulvis]|uniref:Histone-fold n=1 Tax=Penicillium pulvis TaxID=1562058 RepID=UPI0025488A9F|nr:Histone-fold [Penicillium pulvis]KAJ5786017.1 Histone-fold [Penicillium pulvis]
MSSPPPYQTPTTSLKRPSISSTTSQPIMKKQRMHPLRQTSFPANLEPTERSFGGTSDAGSVTGSFTGSLGGTSADGIFAGAARGKKRGRKSKADKERERDDAMSTRTGDAGRFGSADAEGSVRGGMGGGRPADDGDDYDDDDDEGELLGREEGATDTEAEKKNLAILVDAFNPIQSERYDLFKRAKLRKESLRRIVNHALSQSVPASVVTSVNGFTKVFAGEMIEKARTVQAEWADAHDQAARAAFDAEEAAAEKAAQAKAEAQAQEMAKRATPTSSGMPALGNGIKKESPDPSQAQASPKPGYNNLNSTSSPAPSQSSQHLGLKAAPSPVPLRPRREFRPPPNPHRGQLLPSHLREAQRRCKRDGEGGGVGFSGMSMDNLGVKGAFTWSSGSVGGRRLFR